MREYLSRPRYINAARTEVEYPTDHFEADADKLIAALPDKIDNPVALFGWLFDRYAESRDRMNWAVFDLLPELRYTTYRRLIPGIRLAVMQRDPREAIAEGLFWRTYPDPPADRARRFKSMLFQWSLSCAVTRSLSLQFGNDILPISFNELLTDNSDEHSRVARAFDMDVAAVREAFTFHPSFTFTEGLGFRGPDGAWHHLLDDEELEQVHAVANGRALHPDMRALLALAPHAPVLARSIGDTLIYPGTNMIRRINAFRQALRDTEAGIRLALQAEVRS